MHQCLGSILQNHMVVYIMNLDYCYIIHRYGTLKAGESIVMVITCSKHRKEAYAANQYIIDWLKINAPFWKKEIFENKSKWVEQTL